jgi:hypothetical protein
MLPGADSSEPALLRAYVARLQQARSFPYLPRLGLGFVGRASVPLGSISTQHGLLVPRSR